MKLNIFNTRQVSLGVGGLDVAGRCGRGISYIKPVFDVSDILLSLKALIDTETNQFYGNLSAQILHTQSGCPSLNIDYY